MRNALYGLAFLALAIVGSGCASVTLSTYQPVTAPPSQVSIVISDRTAQRMTPEEIDTFRRIINQSLLDGGIFMASPDNKAVASVSGEITVYDPGSRGLRYCIGCGAGKGTLHSTWSLKDAGGTVVGNCQIDGSISAGLFGGGFGQVVEKAGRQLVRFLRGSRR